MTILKTIARDDTAGPIAILKITGPLMDAPSVRPFSDDVERLGMDGIRDIVVDLSEIKWFGASMLGVLTSVLGRVRERDGDVVLVGVSQKIGSVLMATCLNNLFKSFDTVEDALGALSESSAHTRCPSRPGPRWNQNLPQYVLDYAGAVPA
jgi:anti-anti-sigma factor